MADNQTPLPAPTEPTAILDIYDLILWMMEFQAVIINKETPFYHELSAAIACAKQVGTDLINMTQNNQGIIPCTHFTSHVMFPREYELIFAVVEKGLAIKKAIDEARMREAINSAVAAANMRPNRPSISTNTLAIPAEEIQPATPPPATKLSTLQCTPGGARLDCSAQRLSHSTDINRPDGKK